jgi:hypothetical protein
MAQRTAAIPEIKPGLSQIFGKVCCRIEQSTLQHALTGARNKTQKVLRSLELATEFQLFTQIFVTTNRLRHVYVDVSKEVNSFGTPRFLLAIEPSYLTTEFLQKIKLV